MKTLTHPLATLFVALFFVAALALAGCSASTISGPDLAPSDEVTQVDDNSTNTAATHNEGANKGKGSSTTSSASRN
ncbi:MAG: hypothetical protein ACE5G0_03335 [Rhodothermales bacterium]